jgi:hypothetical protein
MMSFHQDIFQMRFINPDTQQIRTMGFELYKNEINKDIHLSFIAAWKLQLETALIFDAVTMFGEALSNLPKNFASPILDCHSAQTWMYGTTLINLIKGVSQVCSISLLGKLSFQD